MASLAGLEQAIPSAPSEGLLLFAGDGRLVATGLDRGERADPPPASLSELQDRYRQSDGMPLVLAAPGQVVGVPLDPGAPRVLFVSQPLRPAERRGEATLAVALVPFKDEQDPQTVQRALGSVLAHELRTPLTTVFGGAQLLVAPAISDATRAEAAQSVAAAAEQLYRVVEDLVVFVRWAADVAPDPEPVLVQPILRAIVGRHRDGAIRVEARVPAVLSPVRGTPAHVEHILRNVLHHAIGNSPRGGRVRINARDAGPWVEITVADEGPTRDTLEQAHAFDLFAPTHRQAADPSGANLSLVLARRLVNRLGGSIRAGRPAHGGTVVVAFRSAMEPRQETDAAGEPQLARRRTRTRPASGFQASADRGRPNR